MAESPVRWPGRRTRLRRTRREAGAAGDRHGSSRRLCGRSWPPSATWAGSGTPSSRATSTGTPRSRRRRRRGGGRRMKGRSRRDCFYSSVIRCLGFFVGDFFKGPVGSVNDAKVIAKGTGYIEMRNLILPVKKEGAIVGGMPVFIPLLMIPIMHYFTGTQSMVPIFSKMIHHGSGIF